MGSRSARWGGAWRSRRHTTCYATHREANRGSSSCARWWVRSLRMIFDYFIKKYTINKERIAQQMVILNFSEPFRKSCSIACLMLYLFSGFLCRHPSMKDFADYEALPDSGKNISWSTLLRRELLFCWCRRPAWSRMGCRRRGFSRWGCRCSRCRSCCRRALSLSSMGRRRGECRSGCLVVGESKLPSRNRISSPHPKYTAHYFVKEDVLWL